MTRDTSSLQEAKMLLEVLKRIPLNRKISTTDLHQQLTAAGYELSRRTLQRYLKALSESDMGVQCDDKSKPFGYRRLLNSNDLDRVGLGADGALLLLLAREHLRYQMPPDLTNSLSYLFDAAENYMHTASGSSPEKRWLSKVRFVSGSLPLCPPMIRPLIFNKVSEGLFKQVKLDIVYFKSVNEEEVQLRVSPLGLVQQDVRLYLVCCYEDTTQIRNLALHRIKKVELTTFIAEEPKGFDLQQYVDRSPFNYGNAQKVLLEMVFKNRQTALILRETPFNRMQKLEERRDGTFKLTVEVADTVLLTGWIEAWREKAGIISVKKTPIQ